MRKNLTLLLILIALTVVAGVLYQTGVFDQSQSMRPLSDFAIEDTAAVNKIFIADQDGNQALLERNDQGWWTLNGKYRAMDYKVGNVLEGFHNIRLKGPVPRATVPGVIKMIAGRGRKVEIYQNDAWVKTWYIGTCTQDHFGTYMVLETPEDGRSSEPMIMRAEGFTGCLLQRYFAWEGEWRHTGVFNYPKLDISRVEMIDHGSPDNSFDIRYGGGNDLELHSPLLEKRIEVFDTLAVKDYLIRFKQVHFETFSNYLTENQQDSLRNALPAFTIRVTENDGDVRKVDLYWKTAVEEQLLPNGEVNPYDGDRMFAHTAADEIVLAQRMTFDPLTQGIGQFVRRVDE